MIEIEKDADRQRLEGEREERERESERERERELNWNEILRGRELLLEFWREIRMTVPFSRWPVQLCSYWFFFSRIALPSAFHIICAMTRSIMPSTDFFPEILHIPVLTRPSTFCSTLKGHKVLINIKKFNFWAPYWPGAPGQGLICLMVWPALTPPRVLIPVSQSLIPSRSSPCTCLPSQMNH